MGEGTGEGGELGERVWGENNHHAAGQLVLFLCISGYSFLMSLNSNRCLRWREPGCGFKSSIIGLQSYLTAPDHPIRRPYCWESKCCGLSSAKNE